MCDPPGRLHSRVWWGEGGMRGGGREGGRRWGFRIWESMFSDLWNFGLYKKKLRFLDNTSFLTSVFYNPSFGHPVSGLEQKPEVSKLLGYYLSSKSQFTHFLPMMTISFDPPAYMYLKYTFLSFKYTFLSVKYTF